MISKQNANEEFKNKKAGIDRLLLLVCCAPCLASAVGKLKGIDVTCYFYNPNIMPMAEWNKRLNSVKKLIEAINAGRLGDEFGKFDLVVPAQNDNEFFDAISGVEFYGEHSIRCTNCIAKRLKKTAEYAASHDFCYFATTLTSSAQKSVELINSIGEMVGKEHYVPSDFKKDAGALESKRICDLLGIYRQNYCGCGLPEKQIKSGFEDILSTPFMIGNVKVPNRLLLAPMAGYSDVGFRAVTAICGAGYTTTEMVSAKALAMGSKKTKELLETTSNEKVKAIQLFGNDPNVFAAAVRMPDLQKFDIIDINMGCPMPKIVKNGDGSALMDSPEKASEIIKAVKAATDKPVTVKFRKGGQSENAIEFAKMCESAGADAIIVHGRTRDELYIGDNDFNIIKRIVESVSIPVIVSGDIKTRKQAAWALHFAGAAAVMIGRGAIGNPSVFGRKISSKDAVLTQIKIDKEVFGEKRTLIEVKKHIVAYFKGFGCAVKIRKQILEAQTIAEIELLLKNNNENI